MKAKVADQYQKAINPRKVAGKEQSPASFAQEHNQSYTPPSQNHQNRET